MNVKNTRHTMMIITKHVTQHAMKMKGTEFLNIQLL